MNEWLDRGLFCCVWIGMMWIVDLFFSNTGVISYPALMVGAISLALLGAFEQFVMKKRNT